MKKNLLFSFFLLTYLSLFSQVVVEFNSTNTETKDVIIGSLSSNNSATGLTDHMSTWTQNGQTRISRTLLDFDISSLPKSIKILDAKLLLFSFQHSVFGGNSGNNLNIVAERITSDWEEFSVNWATQPSIDSEIQAFADASETPEDIEMDVTEIVTEMINDKANSFGFSLRLEKEIIYNQILFGSFDNPYPCTRPVLLITYEVNTAIKKILNSNKLIIAPNPSFGLFSISNDTEVNFDNVILRDVLGKTIRYYQKDIKEISIQNSGIYFLEFHTSDGIITKKIIVK